MNPTSRSASPLNSPSNGSLLGSIVDSVPHRDHDDENALLERRLSSQTATTIKTLSPLLQVIASEQAGGMSDEDAAKLCRKLIIACRKHSAEVCLALDISPESDSWARNYYAGVIAEQIASRWPHIGNQALDVNWAVSLSEVAQPMLTSGLPPSWHETPLEVSIMASLLNAMQNLMREYDRFNMLHRDRQAIVNEFSKLLMDTCLDEANAITDERGLSDAARNSVAQSFIKHGGFILSQLWNSHCKQALSHYQESATESEKNYFKKHGFPLEDIKVGLVEQMRHLATIADMSLERLQPKQPASSMSMS